MTVHLFGAVSSPSCKSYALRNTANDNKSDFPAKIVQTVKGNFYVDDFLSVDSEEEAIKVIQNLCKKDGFILEKWVSNSRAVLQTTSENQRGKNLK